MFYKDWKPIYEEIAEDFNYNLNKERKSAAFLNKFFDNKKIFSLENLEDIIKNKKIVVFGAGPSLSKSIILNKEKFEDMIKISADGATSALLKNDIFPDIIVTDLDGNVSDQINSNSNGSVTIIHAHGDNFSKLKKHLPYFKKDIIGTTQIDPTPYKNIHNFGGFTDGDRAVFLTTHFNAEKIFLIGFDFNGKIGKYSNPDKKDTNLKLKKLKWCKKLLDMLTLKNQNIYYL
jgi:uncharacterized Rossmann fold enzyme